MLGPLRDRYRETLEGWAELSLYQRFEQLVALVLTTVISVVVVFALYYLVVEIFGLLFLRLRDPFDFRIFQLVFEMILTVLIAMEFNHSIVRTMQRRESIIQFKIVLLIALLALVRKFIVLDYEIADPMLIASLAVALLAIGGVYWLMRERDDRLAERELSEEQKREQQGMV